MMSVVEEITALALVIAEQRSQIAELQMRLDEALQPGEDNATGRIEELTTRNVELLDRVVQLEKQIAEVQQ